MQTKPKRIAERGHRHRRDNGPQVLEVTEAPPLAPDQKGTLHTLTEEVLREGPAALIAEDKRGKVLAEQCGLAYDEEFKSRWALRTTWLDERLAGSPLAAPDSGHVETPDDSIKRDTANPRASVSAQNGPKASNAANAAQNAESAAIPQFNLRARAAATYALLWRPTFLATVALTHSVMLGAKAASVNFNTVLDHRKWDAEFDGQVLAAQAYCIEMLHAVTMRSALEGDIEPVYWQGIRVDWIRKFDNRLRVELLRAHLPKTFKTPGSHVAVSTGDTFNVLSVGPEEQQELMAMRARSLARMKQAMVVQVHDA